MGGTRFVGKALVQILQGQGHSLTLFNRGNRSIPDGVEHLFGDRSTGEGLRQLQDRCFDVIVDSSGRRLQDSKEVIERTGFPKHRFLYVSSAGVYAESEQWPLDEKSPIDTESRHIGKVDTENWLIKEKIPFTSFRPTYIYGPGNYNSIERWFFDRILFDQPVPLPGDGNTITQLGHVVDLADAMARSLQVEASKNKIYNCSGNKGITFLGLIHQAAIACGKDPKLVATKKFDPSVIESKARKAFPLRLNHFLTDTTRVQQELGWLPKIDIATGLVDSFINDYSLAPTIEPDFTLDKNLFGA